MFTAKILAALAIVLGAYATVLPAEAGYTCTSRRTYSGNVVTTCN